jgi:hypothetical protein
LIVVLFFVGLALLAVVVACAAWAFAAGREVRDTMRSTNGRDGVTARGRNAIVGVVAGLLLGGLAVGLFAAAQVPDYVGPCGRDEAARTKRHAIDPVEYEKANLELARGIAQFAAGEKASWTSHPLYRCSGSTTSDVVGLTTTFVVAPLPASKCSYMNSLEADLRAAGWVVHSVETPSLNSAGFIRATSAERGRARIDVSIDGLGTQLFVSVDHDSLQLAPLPPGFPTSPCG